jgi:hypothetical protein
LKAPADRRFRLAAIFVLVLAALAFGVTSVLAGSGGGKSAERSLKDDAEGNFDVLEQADQYAEARTAPADTVDAGAFSQGYAAYKALPVTPGTWTQLTTGPYDSDARNYRDPVWSNSGGGAGHVAGRTTALAADGSTLYAGGADGGVWKKVGNGAWQPLTDDAPTLSTGALLVDPSHGLWVGTGEANTNSDSYAGIGVLYSADGGATFTRVGGDELNNHTIGRLVYDNGFVLAATSRGLYRHSATTTSGAWTPVLKEGTAPLPASCSQSGGASSSAFVSDVAVKPGTSGGEVDAVVGWRAGSNCNGFYASTDGGQTFSPVKVTGAINEADLGRATIAWSADGSKIYALVQSASLFNHPSAQAGGTELQGIYESDRSFAGPWNKVAEATKLMNAGSALKSQNGYKPGVQGWYNQFLAVDPANANHVFLGLEEVFETKDGGTSWNAVGPYWNFGLPCSANGLDSCPPTTHADQHAVAIANGQVYVGDDGGVYTRGLTSSSPFASLNDGLDTLQYYYADAGPVAGGDAYWGGLQDNGESLLRPGSSTMVSPFGGDGGDTYVDKTDGDKAINEYTGLDMALTTNGGVSDGTTPSYREISPSCSAFTYTPSPCDPSPRFIAPFEADQTNPTHWIAGGEFVWDNQNKGWNTTCSASGCDWKIVGDTGAGHSVTQLSMANGTWYAAWCGGGCNGSTFTRGILTNVGGTVHQLTLPSSFPNRFIQGLTVDSTNVNHVYAVFSSFSRRWTGDFSAGEGHVFETNDGGATWTDISGNLPDIPGDDILITSSGKLVVASDVGVMVSTSLHGGTWTRLGSNLPNVSVNDLQLIDGGTKILAATHGRGLWTIPTP